MKTRISLCILFFFSILYYGCKDKSDITEPKEKVIVLEGEATYGWTGTKTFITVYNDLSAVRNKDTNPMDITFSEEKKQRIITSFSDFPNYKRMYKPANGIWFDIDTFELIYKNDSASDTVSIYEPLDTEEIPESLVKLVEALFYK